MGGWWLGQPGASSDNFLLQSPSTINSITFSSWSHGSGPSIVFWKISSSPGGVGSIASGTAGVSDSFNGTDSLGSAYSIYNSTFLLQQNLSAGNYWLTLSTNNSSNGSYVYWGTSNNGIGGNAYSTQLSTGNFTAIAGWELSLEVEGTPVAPVPEPGSMILLGSGLLGTAYAVRRKLIK